MAKKRKGGKRRKQGNKPATVTPSTVATDETDDADEDAGDEPKRPTTAEAIGAALRDAAKPAAAKPASPRPAPLPEAIVRGGPQDPVFWFGFEVAWAKIAATRFIIFMLLALDAVLQLGHAPRYGAGNFNVGQLPFLDGLGAGRVAYGVAQLALAYMFVMIAFGVATRVLVPICAVVYAWLYFGSQLDSYQHHYLVALVIAIACFVPWQRPTGATPSTPVRSWAVRLLLVQLAVMYLWAAISKMNLAWVDGTTLSMQMTGAVAKMITSSVGYKVASVLVIGVELALAATIWSRPGWKIAAPLGLAFHAGIIFTGLEIGLFAFLMLGIYALVVPDRFWVAVAGKLEGAARRLAKPSWVAYGIGLVASVGIAKLVRFEDGFVIGIATCIVPLALAAYAVAKKSAPIAAVGVAHALALLLWLAVDRTTDVTKDYYRFWGGSQRRLGSPAIAEYAYRRLTEVMPDGEAGHYQLGRLLIKRGAIDEGLRELHEAQRLEPAIARSFVEEARLLLSQGKTAEAIEKAKQATYADPSHADARALLDSLTNKKPVQPGAVDDSE